MTGMRLIARLAVGLITSLLARLLAATPSMTAMAMPQPVAHLYAYDAPTYD